MLATFSYERVRTVEAGCRALADAARGAVLAGGTDLLVQMRAGTRSPDLLVDCKGIEALHALHVHDQGLEIGACVLLNRLLEDATIRALYPALCKAAGSIGTYTLRNRATLVGNLCNASPAADAAPVLLVLDGTVHATGTNGTREIPMDAFFAGVKTSVLRPDEIVTSVSVPRRPTVRTAFTKQQRIRGHDLAVVNVAGSYCPQERVLRLAVGSCAPTPVLLPPIPVSADRIDELGERAAGEAVRQVTPICDVRASKAYREAVLSVLVRRVVHDLLEGGG